MEATPGPPNLRCSPLSAGLGEGPCVELPAMGPHQALKPGATCSAPHTDVGVVSGDTDEYEKDQGHREEEKHGMEDVANSLVRHTSLLT